MQYVNPLPGQVLHVVPELGGDAPESECGEYEDDANRRETENLEEATLISSQVKGSKMHKILIDIDFPVQAIPSSTPGHTHLYIDKEVEFADFIDLMDHLAELGIVEEGYVRASERRGFSSLRLPWIKKEKGETEK